MPRPHVCEQSLQIGHDIINGVDLIPEGVLAEGGGEDLVGFIVRYMVPQVLSQPFNHAIPYLDAVGQALPVR